FFLVMDYVAGRDLSKVIEEKRRLSPAESIAIFKQILKGVAFAHTKGIIHRDIKPSNILIDNSNHARINDFGIAILAGTMIRRLPATGTAVGHPCKGLLLTLASPASARSRHASVSCYSACEVVVSWVRVCAWYISSYQVAAQSPRGWW